MQGEKTLFVLLFLFFQTNIYPMMDIESHVGMRQKNYQRIFPPYLKISGFYLEANYEW